MISNFNKFVFYVKVHGLLDTLEEVIAPVEILEEINGTIGHADLFDFLLDELKIQILVLYFPEPKLAL